MNVADCLTLLMSRLGNRTETALRATCLLEMKLFQETECEGGETLPWFLLTETTSTTTTADERRLEVPDDFIREKEEQPVYILDSEGGKHKLQKKSYDELVAHHDDEDDDDEASGMPEDYALEGEYILLFPTPDAAYSVQLKYYAKQTSPSDTATSENGWFKWAPDLMMAGAGFAVATQHLHDTELASVFSAQLQRARQRLERLEVARDEANRDRSMG